MSQDLHDQLIRLANHFGADEQYARAGGGNASVKHDGVLYIKPSGTTLAHLTDDDLVPLRIETLLEALHSDEPVDGDPVMAAAQAARIGDPGGRRPSVEILFHALIPDALVLHLHPLVANAVTCNERGRELTDELLGDHAVWVDYIDPGVPLARGIAAARQDYEARTGQPAPAITMLGNHGIIVSGNSYDAVAERTEWLTARIREVIEATAPVVPVTRQGDGFETLAKLFAQGVGAEAVAWSDDEFIAATTDTDSGPVSRGPLIPDQIVYAGSFPVLLEADAHEDRVREAIEAFRTEHGRSPVVAIVPRRAAFAAGASDKAAENALATYRDALQVARDADRIGKVRVMDERERHFIENWEAEAYRQSVAASS